MSKIDDIIRKTLEDKAAEYLGRPFLFTDYSESGDGSYYLLQGTIQRHGQSANVEVTIQKDNMEPSYWRITDDVIPMPSVFMGMVKLGENVCVTDPCYDRTVWCMSELTDVESGMWEVYACVDEIDCWGKRTYILMLYHECLTDDDKAELTWERYAELGVDSGQMSVFDDAFYRRKDGSIEAFDADKALTDEFYSKCCELSEENVGIFYSDDEAVGVVCSSGCGDGGYPLQVKKLNGKIVAMKINFM